MITLPFVEVIKRYSNRISGIDSKTINLVSNTEGAVVRNSLVYEGRNIDFLDLSTYSTTGTFKDWIACLTIAYCIENNISAFVSQSSGNTANAIAYYATKFKINVTIFYPKCNRYKINSKYANSDYVKLIEIDKHETEIKEYTEKFAKKFNLRWLPDFNLQIEANKLRAYFLHEHLKQVGKRYTWHSQALSSAYGIFGFYKGLDEVYGYKREFYPRICGVQQEAVSPFYDYINHGSIKSHNQAIEIIEPTLFRSQPTQTMLQEMKEIIELTQGEIVCLKNKEYFELEAISLNIILSSGFNVYSKQIEGKTTIIEKSGILATAGILKLLHSKKIKRSENVLITLTGGNAKSNNAQYKPKFIIKSTDTIETLFNLT